jgi:phosphoribosylformimino-5-aminoimidazole carboxamide ribotide isomerase
MEDLSRNLIGVVDLKGGRAVKAVAGRRESYRPIDQAGCRDGNPMELVESYRNPECHFPRVEGGIYVADLDAIMHRDQASAPIIRLMIEQWLRRGGHDTHDDTRDDESCRNKQGSLFIDAGWGWPGWVPAYENLISGNNIHCVVGTESLCDWRWFVRFQQRIEDLGSKLFVSIDLRDGALVSRCAELEGCGAMEAAARFLDLGVRSFIVLDLAGVGLGLGPNSVEVCSAMIGHLGGPLGGGIREQCENGGANTSGTNSSEIGSPEIRLVSGGGVRGPADAQRLVDAGCEGVLVASWPQKEWAGSIA